MRGDGETLVLGSSRSLDCGGLIHNTSCPAPPCPCQQMALWWVKFFFSPVGSREAVPPHCILPGCTESAMPLLLSPNLRYICGSCEKRKKERRRCKLESEETRRAERETPRHKGTFSGFLLLGYRKSRRERDSGSLCPTSLHLPDIRPPTTPRFSSPQLRKHPLCKFYNHATAMKCVCVRTVKRGYKLLLSIWNELGLEWDKEQSEERREYYERRECYERGHS